MIVGIQFCSVSVWCWNRCWVGIESRLKRIKTSKIWIFVSILPASQPSIYIAEISPHTKSRARIRIRIYEHLSSWNGSNHEALQVNVTVRIFIHVHHNLKRHWFFGIFLSARSVRVRISCVFDLILHFSERVSERARARQRHWYFHSMQRHTRRKRNETKWKHLVVNERC